MKKYYALLLTAAVMLMAACSPSAPPSAPTSTTQPAATQPAASIQPVRGGTLRVALSADPITLDPLFAVSNTTRRPIHAIYNPLVRLDKDLTLKPELAEKWDYPDPTTLVMTLRKGVRFHDGSDFNAQAVKVNFERMMDPNSGSPRRSDVASIREVIVADDYTIKLMLKAPNAALLATFSDMAGMMVSPTAIQKYGKDLARNPVGSGPFQFVEWVNDDHLALKKFDGYWEKAADGKPLPYLDGLTYKPIIDGSVRLTALKTATVDIVDEVSAPDVPGLKESKDPVYADITGLGWAGIYLQTTKPPFDKKEVRQAFAWALDRETVARTLTFNSAVAGQQMIPASSWAHDPSIAPYKRDIAKAKSLLQAAAMAIPTKFTCSFQNIRNNSQLAQAWKEQVSEAGLDMSLEMLEGGALNERFATGNFQCILDGWSGRPDPDGNVYGQLRTGGSLNATRYSNKQVDELLDKARAVYDQAQRKQLYSEAMKIVVDDAPILVTLWFRPGLAHTAKLQNFVLVPDGIMRFKDVWLSK